MYIYISLSLTHMTYFIFFNNTDASRYVLFSMVVAWWGLPIHCVKFPMQYITLKLEELN